jgi:uncharacterized protein YkwD
MPTNLFDAKFYRAANPGLANLSDEQALSHFQSYGLNEGLRFSPFVDLNFYRSSNSELAGLTNQEAYDHLSNNGVAEGRKFSALFDLNFYKTQNADLAGYSNEQLFEHLRDNGVNEGRQVSKLFDVNFYLADNPDVAAQVAGNRLAALQEFELEGLNQGRRFSVAFDADYYKNVNPDLAAANLTREQLLDHYALYGVNEGRVAAETFNVSNYLANNSDLAGLNNSQAYDHFVTTGLRDGRIASGYINSDFAGNSLSEARSIALDSKAVIWRDAVGQVDTSDVYTFTLGNQSSDFNLILNGLTADLDVEFLNSNGEAIARGANSGNASESLSIKDLQGGTYYIRVYQGIGGGDSNYNLSLSAPVTPVSSTPITPMSATPQSSGNSFIDKVVQLTNNYRTQNGLAPLQINLTLNNVAQSHSEDMALRDYFSHKGSNGSSASDRVLNAGYNYSYVGENIAAGYTTPEAVVQGWINSPGHRANILNANFKEIGIGYYYLANDTGSVNYKSYWTQEFGTPRS